MSRWRAIRLVAMREIIERGRSRGYVLSLAFTVFLLVVGLHPPVAARRGGQPTQLGDRGRGAARASRRRSTATAAAYEIEVDVEVARPGPRSRGGGAPRRVDRRRAAWSPRTSPAPGELIVHERARARAPGGRQPVGDRAPAPGPRRSEPPVVDALEPPSDEDATALIFANAGIILMFIGIFSYGSWVLTGVVEEKQSRVVEVVLSTVRPRDLLMGKVLGIGLLALAQLVVLVAVGIIAVAGAGPARAARDDDRCGRPAADLVHPRVRVLLDDDGLPGGARVAAGGGLERLDAGDARRDDGLHPARSSWSRAIRTGSSPT